MACQIPYDRLNKLFFDSIAFDPKYKSYRAMANRLLNMDSLTEESKVTAVWYMGLLYNNAIPMDNQIKTEDLPRTVAAIVADKIGEPTADFKGLYKQVQEVFKPKPADEADLSGTSVSNISPYGVIAADYLFTGGRGVILSTDYFIQALSGAFTNAGGLIEQIRQKYTNKVGDLGNLKDAIGTENYAKIIDEIRSAIESVYNNQEINDIFNVVLNNATGFPFRLGNEVSAKLERLNEELATEGKPEVTEEIPVEEKPLTLKEKINAEFKNLNAASAVEFDTIFDRIHNLVKDNPELSVEEQLRVFETLKRNVNNNIKSGKIGEAYRARVQAIIEEYREENTAGVIDYGEVEGIGKNMYVIRQEDGTIFQAQFDETTKTYYRVPLTETGKPEEYIIRETDYITPNYYRPKSRAVSDETGKSVIRLGLAKNGIAFSSEGIGLNARVIDSEKQGYQRSNIELLRDNLKAGSVVNQITIIADRRRVRLNAARAKKFDLEWEHTLRPDQIKALKDNPDMPAVAFLQQKSGVQFTIQNKHELGQYKPGELFSYITSLDNLGFVFANGEVRPVNWSSKSDLDLLSKTLKIRRSSKEGLVDATPADIQVYKVAVENIKKLKNDIIDAMEDDETYELSPEEIRKYFSIVNVPFNWKNIDFKNQNENDTVALADVKNDLTKFGATVTANVGKRTLGGDIVNITTEEVVGIVKIVDGKLEFQNSLGEGKVVLDENNKPLKGGIKTLFLNEGVDEAKIIEQLSRSGKFFGYLTRTSTLGWVNRPLIGTTYINTELDKVSFIASLSALVENLPAFSEENAPLFAGVLNSFAENGWGFNMYAGLIANLDYRKSSSGKKDVFYVNVRPDKEYEYLDGLGDKKIVARFELDFDYRNSILNLKKIASTLKLEYNPAGSAEEKINFGKQLQKKLNEVISDPEDLKRIIENPSKSNAFEIAISELVNEYNNATTNLHEQVIKAIEKHQKHVEKGGKQYLSTERNTLEYLLFNKKGDPSTFKIRDNSIKSDPLKRFRTFDKRIGGENTSVFSINFANPNVINYRVTKTAVEDIPSVIEEDVKTKSSVANSIFGSTRNNNKKTYKLVDTLKGLKIVDDEEWNKQIEEARRILGNLIDIDPTDLSNLDVEGNVLGYYENRTIALNSALKVGGVVYHEAFHGVFRLALTNEKRVEILGAASTLYGPVKQDATGLYLEHGGKKVYFDEFRQKRRYMGLSDELTASLILEEFLADGFRDYKLNKEEPKNALIRVFYKALDFLTKIFTSPKYKAAQAIKSFYSDIDNGKYAGVIGEEITSYPRAYELASVPSYVTLDPITNQPIVNATTVPVEIHEQLKNRVLHELFVRSGNIKNRLEFNQAYEAVTKDLIQEYNIERYFNEKNEVFKNQILEKYAPDFRAMRYMLGSLHRQDVRETFDLNNLSGDSKYDNAGYLLNTQEETNFSIDTFETFREEVFKEFTAIEVGKTETAEEDEDELAKGDIDEDDIENVQSNDPSEIGENFRDDGILTFNPYNGDRNFQKLLRFVKYTYTDPLLNMTYTKMVNNRTIINTIRKVVLNKPFNQKLQALQEHIDILKRNVDEFYGDASLISLLNNTLPTNLIKMEDNYNQLNAVMQFITDMGGLDENYNITIESGRPFINMFHHVFNYSSVELDAIKATTKSENIEGEDSEEGYESGYGTNYEKVELLQKSEINRVRDDFETDIMLSLTNLVESPEVLSELRDAYNVKYETPTSEEGLTTITNAIYKISTMAQLEIPRYVIEYSVAADMKNNAELDSETEKAVDSILDADRSLYNEGNFIKIDTFLNKFKSLYNSDRNSFETSAIDNKVRELVNAYVPAIPLQLLYDASSYSVVVRNLDGKPISKIVPNVPSIEILNQIKNKGLEQTLIRIYGQDQLDFFMDNPFFGSILQGWNEVDKTAKSEDSVLNNMRVTFLDNLKISVSGGLTQEIEYSGRSKKGTFKALGNKSYMLSLLGLFANRQRRAFQKGQTITTFTRPITQLEATSTQFNITGLYQSYHTSKGKLNTNLVVDIFKQALNQEWNRIKKEWSQRNDDKPRREGWNARTIISEEPGGVSKISTTDTNLRAYKFSNSSDFFARNAITQIIGAELEKIARNGVFSFEGALDQLMPDSMETIGEVLSKELINYGTDTYNDLVEYLAESGIEMNDIPEFINIDTGKRNEYNKLVVEQVNITERRAEEQGRKGAVIEEKTDKAREKFLEDFLYNFWFNSMFVNQLFDGDTSVGISNIINYFKRQKSGVAAGPNYRNYSIENEEDDVTVTSTLQEIFGYLNEVDKELAVQAQNYFNKKKISWADGQGYTTLLRRIKKFQKAGLMTDALREALMVARVEYVTRKEQETLEAHDIVLNSDKPVIAGPYDYVKDSEHILLRGDVSTIRPDYKVIVMDLYNQLDGIDTSTPEGVDEYRELIKTIHQYFTPRPDRAFLHILLNSMEYHMVDVVTDESARKKGSPPPTLVNIDSLDADVNVNHPTATIDIKDADGNIVTKEIPMIETGYGNIDTGKLNLYINLSHSKVTVPNELVYDQVLTAAASEAVGDPIQPKIMLPAQLDDPKFGKEVKAALKELRDIESQIATARQEIVNRLFTGGTGTPSGLIAQTIQAGLSRQGASTNLKKLYSTENGKNKYNLNLPIHGKAPLYYLFSLFNNNLFGPKVAGEKYYHVSSLGYKLIFDKATGEQIPEERIKTNPLEYLENRDKYEYRYPSVKIENDKIVVECFIPKKLGQTPEDTRFFERLYGDYLLGMRIPTELKRSMVVVKVVGYLDAAYSNSIVVPPQVHMWAGSDLDIDALYTQGYAYYRNSLNDLVKYNDLTPYTELGLSEDEASFLEFLHFVRDDLGFAELIDLESEKIKANTEYKIESIADGAGLFGINIKQFFEAAEALVDEDIENKPAEYKQILKDVLNKKALLTSSNQKMKLGNDQAEVVRMLLRLVPTINVLNQFEIFGKGKALTVENFKSYVNKNGNPTSPALHNRALKLKTDILSNPIVYDTFTRNFSADQAIEGYKNAAGLLENLSDASKIKKSNMFTPQTVARVRKLNKDAKQMVGGNASNAKTITILTTSKAKLSSKYTFNFQTEQKGKFKKVDTSKFVEKGPIEVSNSIGFATDDGKNQFAGVLNLFINNSGIMNYMYAVGYDPQFAKLIHSVDSIKDVIDNFLVTNDPGYTTPGRIGFSFTTAVNQAVGLAISQNESALRKEGLLIKSESGKKGEYTIDKDAFTIQYSQVLSPVENRLPSSLGITILNKEGNRINDKLASIVTLHFYNQMLQLSNQLSFRLGPVSDVLKKLKPSWTTVSKIRDAVKFIEDNEVFEGSNIKSLFKAYPVIETLAKGSLDFMTDISKQVLLDQTYLVRGITNLFKANRELSEDQVIAELKSILGLQVLRQYVDNEASKLSKDDESGVATIIRTLSKAFTTNYWLANEAGEDLKLLKKKFPNNEFLRSLTTRPALYKPIKGKEKVDVIISTMGNKLAVESQEQLMNDFYYLLTTGDSEVHDAAVNIAIHGIIRDGGMSKQDGYLKVIAPEMFNRLSEQLDKIQDIFYQLDKKDKKIDDVAKYVESLNKGLSQAFASKVTIDKFMQAILNKIVSSVTYDVTGDTSIQMSFWQGSNTAPNKGAFSDIPLPVFTSIVDKILPNNKQFIHTIRNSKIIPFHGLRYTTGKKSDFRFELWKADEQGELLFDLRNVNQIKEQEELNRILRKQGIYLSDGQYSFPLYKVNNYESGQLFILTELDGKPLTSSFFANLFNSYKTKTESVDLLKGSTAKYVVYKRQGLDRISPNGLTSATATALYEAAKGEKSVSSKRVKAGELPKEAIPVPNVETIVVKELASVDDIKDSKYNVGDEEWFVRSGSSTYKVALDRKGNLYIYKRGKGSFFAIYNQAKEISDEKALKQFLEKLGFSDIINFFESDSPAKSMIMPSPGSTSVFALLGYNVNKKSKQGVAPDIIESNPLLAAGIKPTDMGGNAAKDIQMASESTQFIGFGTIMKEGNVSSTNKYAEAWGDKANTGIYSANDTIMISGSGNFGRGGVDKTIEAQAIRKTLTQKYKPLLDKAIEAGASFRVGNQYSKGNLSDQLVAEYLQKKGYKEEKLDGYSRWTLGVKTEVSTISASIPQNKVSGVESFGSTVTANDKVIKALGSNPHSIDMIEAGFRTRTTRSETEMTKYAVKVGDIIKHFGKSADGTTKSILAKVTAIHPKGTPGWKGTWEKEGWRAEDVNVIDRFKNGAAAIEFEVIKPAKLSEVKTETITESGVTETTIEYTPVGKQRQTYTIRGNQVFNKAGQEVFKEDSVDRNKIFANLAVQQGRAVVVEHKGAKYVVNNKDQIISATTGKIMKWDENNGDRKAIIASAKEKFAAKKDQDDNNDVTDNNIFNC